MTKPTIPLPEIFTCMYCEAPANPVVIERIERNGIPHMIILCLDCWKEST